MEVGVELKCSLKVKDINTTNNTALERAAFNETRL